MREMNHRLPNRYLYDAIRKHESANAQYRNKILASGTLSAEEVDAIVSDSADRFNNVLKMIFI